MKNADVPCNNKDCKYLDSNFEQSCSKASDELDNPGIETCTDYITDESFLLREALTRIVNCLETTKANMIERDNLDWFDWCFINQEIAHSKKVLKGGKN